MFLYFIGVLYTCYLILSIYRKYNIDFTDLKSFYSLTIYSIFSWAVGIPLTIFLLIQYFRKKI